MEPLTGLDGARAIRVYTGLGALDARFDARRVAVAVRSRSARAKLAVEIAVARARLLIRPHRLIARPLARLRSRSARRAGARARLARSGRRDQPHPPRPRLGASEALLGPLNGLSDALWKVA